MAMPVAHEHDLATGTSKASRMYPPGQDPIDDYARRLAVRFTYMVPEDI